MEALAHRSAAVSAEPLAWRVSRWIVGLRNESVPEGTRARIRQAVLDTIGCGIYGLRTPWARIVAEWMEPNAAATGATVWGGDGTRRFRPADAAFINGVAAHSFELDDYHNAKLHPGAAVVPAALAVAEVVGASGEDLLKAVTAGYEVMIRTSLALEPSTARLRGWHLTGICGGFGAAAAAAYLMGLDVEKTAWALGLAGTQGAGLFAFTADGAMSKRFHPGRAAQSGIIAAELASRGFSGPTYIFDAEDGGFLRAHSDNVYPERLVDDLGRSYVSEGVAFKPYSCCGSVHSSIDAALDLRRHFGPPRPGDRVRVGVSRVLDVQCGFDYEPQTVLQAQMSLRYCVAVALVEGAALPPQFSDEAIARPDLVRLAQAVELVHDPELDRLYPGHFAGWVEMTRGPETRRVDVLDPRGSAARPMSDDELEEKFRGLVAAARGDGAAEATKRVVDELFTAPDVARVIPRLAAP